MEVNRIALAVGALIVSPVLGAFLSGVDRRITARLQSRVGPPIAQPIYDFGKLMSKRPMVMNNYQTVSVCIYLASMMLSLLLLVLGMDMLVMLFVLALGSIALTLGAFSVKSPYSQIGAQREVLQMLAYEPMLVLMVVATYMKTHSFQLSSVFGLDKPLLLTMPLFLLTMLVVMMIKLHKSPMDISGAQHAHQELISGIYTDFSGRQLAIIEVAHWVEVVFLLGMIALFWHTNPIIGILLALASYLVVIVIDNITARMTWRWMLQVCWTFGLGAAALNLAALYVLAR